MRSLDRLGRSLVSDPNLLETRHAGRPHGGKRLDSPASPRLVMFVSAARSVLMALILGAGWMWLVPPDPAKLDPGMHFDEVAERAGVLNLHTMLRVSSRFDNIQPWMSSVGAAVAAVDYDNDGWTDFYVTNSGRQSTNRL